MALQKCFECSGVVSSTALTCPHCGAPSPANPQSSIPPRASTSKIPHTWGTKKPVPLIEPKKKKSHKGRWFFLFLVFLLFFIVFSNGPQQDKNANTAAQKPAASLPLPQKIATKEEIAAIPKEPDASGKRDPKRQALATTKSREYDSGKQALMLVLAEKAVRNKLKDPESAQFKNVYFSMGSDNLPMVCGQVNAKNAMGGFTGFEYFISNGLPQTTYLQSEIEDVETAWNRFCAK